MVPHCLLIILYLVRWLILILHNLIKVMNHLILNVISHLTMWLKAACTQRHDNIGLNFFLRISERILNLICKIATFIIDRGRATDSDGIVLLGGTIEALFLSSSYKYLGILEGSDFEHNEVKVSNYQHLQMPFQDHTTIKT